MKNWITPYEADKLRINKAPQTGFYLAHKCEICGKQKSSYNHARCSKIKQMRSGYA
jgi:hypothetical protein